MREKHLSTSELLLMVDGDLADTARADVTTHVAMCGICRARLRTLIDADRHVSRAGLPWDDGAAVVPRPARSALLVRLAAEPPPWPLMRILEAVSLHGALLAATLALAAAGTLAGWYGWQRVRVQNLAHDVTVEPGALPIRHLTPGATVALPAADLCRQLPVEPMPVPATVRAQVLQAYGMADRPEHEYELDYLVTPDLGGAPDPKNLWPEPYGFPVWNARVKDELEDLLPRLVCEGKLDLQTAQQDIATDWIAAYKKYFATDRPVRLYSSRTLAQLE